MCCVRYDDRLHTCRDKRKELSNYSLYLQYRRLCRTKRLVKYVCVYSDANQQRNCHSLPYLYKIIMDELGYEWHLALAPNHMYIKTNNKKVGWYNIFPLAILANSSTS